MSMLRRRLSSVGEGIDSFPWIEVSVEGLQNCYLPVFSHMYIADITDMATGMKLWERFPDANGEKCFEGCMQLDNYSSIPSSWK